MAKGRKTDYTVDKLKKLVNDYVKQNLNKKITITGLVKSTNVSKNTWYRCQEIIDYINDLNTNPDTVASSSNGEYPTPSELYDKCKGEEQKTKAIFTQLLDIIESLSTKISDAEDLSSKKVSSEELELLKEQLREKERIIMKQNDKINSLILNDDKLINIGDNLENMNAKTFSEQFGYLFDD